MHHDHSISPRRAALRLATAFFILGLLAAGGRADTLYFSEDSGNVKKVAENGTVTTIGTGMDGATGLGMNSLGELFVASQYGYVYKIDAGGVQSQFASVNGNLRGLAIGADNRVYVGNEWGGIYVYEADGTLATVWNNTVPYGLTFGPDGRLYAADMFNNSIVAFDLNGVRSLVWDLNVLANGAGISPYDLAFDAAGNLYMSGGPDYLNGVYKITPDGVFSNVVPENRRLSFLIGVEVDGEGNIYGASQLSDVIQKTTPEGTTTRILTAANGLDMPTYIIAVGAVPEPAAAAALAGLLALGFAACRRRRAGS